MIFVFCIEIINMKKKFSRIVLLEIQENFFLSFGLCGFTA